MQKIFPIFAFAAGIYAALGIWFPRFRGHWRGTRMACGAVSCTGFAFFFIGMGSIFLVGDALSERHGVWLFLLIIVSWILGAIGYTLDGRTYARSLPEPLTPIEAKQRGQTKHRGWIFVVCGIYFLIMFLWLFVFHK